MKVGRNDPCPCGSGRKYKKCCLAADEAAARSARAEAREEPSSNHGTDKVPGPGCDAFSPDVWTTLEKRLSKSARAEFAPVLGKLKESAEFTAKRPAVEAAQDELEAYRHDYEQLIQDERAFMDRAEKLFAEPGFDSMRFSVADLEQAFEAVGSPTAVEGADFVAFAGRVTRFLLDDRQRSALARRLVCLVPDYVANQRYLDAWIIQHNFILVCEPPEEACSPFLLCMFMQALREWNQERSRDERALLDQIGLTPETIREHGCAEVETLLDDVMARQDKAEAVDRFLESHPKLAAEMQAQCRLAEDAAVDLLQREQGQCLLLDDAEVKPWLEMLAERICARPELAESAMRGEEPSKKLTNTFGEIMVGVASEMATDIFTRKRLRRLRDDIETLRTRFEREGNDESLAVSGLLVAASVSTPPAESHVLTKLCLLSIMRATENLRGVTGAPPSRLDSANNPT